MPVVYSCFISRWDLRAVPDWTFIFGDNAVRRGLGGQAKEMRGEPNALGIITKWLPSNTPDAYFTDELLEAQVGMIDNGIDKLRDLLIQKKTVVFPGYGIGTGRSGMADKAPRTWTYLNTRLDELGIRNPMYI